MLSDQTLQRIKERASKINMEPDKYINYIMDTKLNGKTSTGSIKTVPISNLPYVHDEVFTAIVYKDNGKYLKFHPIGYSSNTVFQIKKPKNLLNSSFQFNEEVTFRYTEYESNNKIYGRIQQLQT